jgi:8-oxo-dGTP pyrophosphatase MutT (NUDIX family)
MADPIADLSEEEIARRLAEPRGSANKYSDQLPILQELFPEPPRPAAVLIPFLRKEQTWQVLFTRRTDTLPEHSGQVAFPGGRSDPEDISPEATALREAQEEIGLDLTKVRLLGRLDRIPTITNYWVTPVVGVIPWPFRLCLALEEVSRTFTVPLSWLANPDNHEIHQRSLPPPYAPVPVIYFKQYDGELLWGVSAQITLNLLAALHLL